MAHRNPDGQWLGPRRTIRIQRHHSHRADVDESPASSPTRACLRKN
jgi:hypothetical protein